MDARPRFFLYAGRPDAWRYFSHLILIFAVLQDSPSIGTAARFFLKSKRLRRTKVRITKSEISMRTWRSPMSATSQGAFVVIPEISLYDISYIIKYLFFKERTHIIQTGIIYVLLSIALNASRRQTIAPVPLGTEALSSSLNALVICVGGLMLFLISIGCS